MGSSLANQSSFQSKNIIHDSVVTSNVNEDFKTANNSSNNILANGSPNIETNQKLEKIQNQLNQMWAKYQAEIEPSGGVATYQPISISIAMDRMRGSSTDPHVIFSRLSRCILPSRNLCFCAYYAPSYTME